MFSSTTTVVISSRVAISSRIQGRTATPESDSTSNGYLQHGHGWSGLLIRMVVAL